MRFFKRLIQVLAILVILGGAGLGVAYHLTTRTPEGYNPAEMSAEERDAAARRVDTQKLPQLLSMADKARVVESASQIAHKRGLPVPPDATQPVDAVTVTFTQDELNASLWKWWGSYKDRGKVEAHFADPYLKFEDGKIILMGTVPEYKKVMSVYFEPRLDDAGALHCDMTGVRLGSLPLPQVMLSKQRDKLVGQLLAGLPGLQAQAKMDSAGVSNLNTSQAALSKLILRSIDGQSSPPVIFVVVGGGQLPLRLTTVNAKNGELTITAAPLNSADRAALFANIKEPYPKAGTP